MSNSKHCKKCETTKLRSEFYKRKGTKSGLVAHCKTCMKKYYEDNKHKLLPRKPQSSKTHYAKNKEKYAAKAKIYYEENKEQILERGRRYKTSNPHKAMWHGAKARAKEKEIPFDLTSQDIIIPTLCPILKIPLVSGKGCIQDDSPTLDRKIPILGYVKGNVMVISSLANRIKSNANSMQIAAVLNYVKQIEEDNI